MRCYKTAVTKPIPKEARYSTRKDVKFVTATINGKRITAPVTDKGTMRIEADYYSLSFRCNQGIFRHLRAYGNRRDSEELGRIITKLMEPEPNIGLAEDLPARIKSKLIAFGIIDNKKSVSGRTLSDLIDDYKDWMQSTRVTRHGLKRCDEYVQSTITMIRRVADACKFNQWSDISKAAFEKYLGDMNVRSRTYNHYLVAFKGFCLWVVSNELAARNPLTGCKGISSDDKEKRRPLSPDEFNKLLEATAEAPRRFELTPEQRVLMYLLATETGLRKNELVNLTVSSFHLDKGVVRLPREVAKNRHAVELPLRQERIAHLRKYLSGKLPMVKLFPVTQSLRASNMLKKDLKDAGIPFKTDKGVVVFHALRNTFSTNLSRTDASWIEHKVLMRHSLKGEITADYTEVSIDRLKEIVEQLPSFGPKIAKAVG